MKTHTPYKMSVKQSFEITKRALTSAYRVSKECLKKALSGVKTYAVLKGHEQDLPGLNVLRTDGKKQTIAADMVDAANYKKPTLPEQVGGAFKKLMRFDR